MVWRGIGQGQMTARHNKALHQTRRGGVPAARPVVEARPAGEAGCSTELWWWGHNGCEEI
jgi:hypothetical protein